MGLLPQRRGVVEFEGQRVDQLPAFRIARLGLGLVPEGRQIFPNLTVRENLVATAANRTGPNHPWTLERVFSFFPQLQERSGNFGNQLSGGEQQMLAIGRALMARPRLVLLDEPSMGLAPRLIQQIFSIITEINEQGTTVLLVEQNAAQALRRADHAHVLETGEIVRSGTGEELSGDESVKAAYLGGDL